jgi:AcrR family transcriptional regulator
MLAAGGAGVSERQIHEGRQARERRSREQIVEAIVAAATEIFSTRENATVRAIAARAGVQPSIIFRYFGSKKALLGEVVARGARRDAEIVAKYLGGPPPALLAATLDENTAYRAALLRGVLTGLEVADVPGGVASVEFAARALASGAYSPLRPGERFDPRLVAAFLAAAMAGWQATGRFFTAAAGLGNADEAEVDAAVAYVLDQIYALADPDLRMDDDK